RAVSFAIADGQLPSNNKAGYVIRRILRRAVRYAYSFLDVKEPFMYKLVDTLVDLMGESFPELVSQKTLVEKVINDEETVFLRTLDRGLRLLDSEMEKLKAENKTEISGSQAFVLYDTYGFPLDLSELIAREKGYTINKNDFDAEMSKQKERARNAAEVNTDDWVVLSEGDCEFTGYDSLVENVKIMRYRKVMQKNETLFHIVFDKTPFYAEKGGQVGDKGYIDDGKKKISIINTIEEHNLKIHVTKSLPEDINDNFEIVVDTKRRTEITNNHTATHLLHQALRSVLGTHVEQKGSMVNDERLRFDFAHFSKMTAEEIRAVEVFVNERIRENIVKDEKRDANIEEAKAMGAMALFGEKYGNVVRVVRFAGSIELCGGTHVERTGQIGFFKIVSESAVAAGVRRIEAITGQAAQDYIFKQIDSVNEISTMVNNPKGIVAGVENLVSENAALKKQVENYKLEDLKVLKKQLVEKAETRNETTFICTKLDNRNANEIKEICSQLRGELDNFACVIASVSDEKPSLVIAFSDNLVKDKGLHAGNLVKEAAKIMQGGGGGQPFVATAGGKDVDKLPQALEFAKDEICKKL
ncbi:MAG: alanine--tRNA ligase, partial [Bacteroidales bacterium]|nr:alanine--tRNA ligase [Bacteroidales bacterium]